MGRWQERLKEVKTMTKKKGSAKQTKTGNKRFAVLDHDKARKSAASAMRTLEQILKDARADMSVSNMRCNRLEHALQLLGEELEDLLPVPGLNPTAKLPNELFEADHDKSAEADDGA